MTPESAGKNRTIVVSPNNSLTPQGALVFFSIISLTCASVGLGFAAMGFWPILPFVGLEILVLGLCLRLSLRRGDYREVIFITNDKIITESGTGVVSKRVEFQRHWTKVELEAATLPHHPHRLLIRSGVRCCEVASCLTEAERKGLWTRLSELIGRVDQSPPLLLMGDETSSSKPL